MSNEQLNRAANNSKPYTTKDLFNEPKKQTVFDQPALTDDLNNVFTIIICLAELIRVHPRLPSEFEPDLSRIVAQVWRAAELIRQFFDWQSYE